MESAEKILLEHQSVHRNVSAGENMALRQYSSSCIIIRGEYVQWWGTIMYLSINTSIEAGRTV